jgi:prophage regulatory protein
MVQRFLRIGAVEEATGMSRSWVYREIQRGRFPKPIRSLGQKASVWPEADIAAWQQARLAERDQAEIQPQ